MDHPDADLIARGRDAASRPAGRGRIAPQTAGPRVCILLAVCNGARHLPEQLESYAAQTRDDWSLLVSDDGSEDGSVAMVEAFAGRIGEGRVTLIEGPRKGHFVPNFLHLFANAPDDVPFVAVSDQDDVWLPDKLDRALRALEQVPAERPAIYCARTLICDDDLVVTGKSSLFLKPPCFGNALVQSIGGGNTMVLNRAALSLAQAAGRLVEELVAHDWWLYQLITGAGGQVIYDPEPVLKYRQHAHNQIGSNLSYRARVSRVWQLLNGRFRRWNDTNEAALGRLMHLLTPDARRQAALFAEARRNRNPFRRLARLRMSGVFRQGRSGTLALYLSCLIGRI